MFKIAAQMVRGDPELLAMIKIVDSTKTIRFAVVVTFHAATLAARRTLLPTWTGLAPARSRQLRLAHRRTPPGLEIDDERRDTFLPRDDALFGRQAVELTQRKPCRIVPTI